MMMIHKTMWRTKLLFPRPASIIVDKEECPKEIWEVEVDSSSSKSLKPEFINGSYEIGTSEDSEDEKGAGEAGNKAMEWTTDDQKNLMDLGTPEIERNKRLESLIARQKARKLFSLQVRRTLRNMGSKIPWLKLLIFQYQKAIFFRIRVVNVHQAQEFQFRGFFNKEFMQDCADTSVFRDIGLRKRASKGIECSKSGNQLGDQIKEVIRVCELGFEHHNEEDNLNCRQLIPIDDVHGRPSSSEEEEEEDEPFYKIDEDALLKSIASPATRIVAEDGENNGQTG
ncbi:uncharacterized protein LOC111375226 isoform X2 [Olea europaea var. sylvestris]|nr:uncharacterized protein LOC111375226 isoform X2 [Olea europaea var. sylvestris]